MVEKKIVILDAQTTNPGDLSWKEVEKLGGLTIYDDTDHGNQEIIIDRIKDAEIVITNKVPLSRSVLKRTSNLEYINVLATGVNVIDLEAATELGIAVSNIPDYSTESVAQLTLAHLLEISQRVGHHSQEVKNGRWEEMNSWSFYDYPLIELSGKTMGIIGFGEIGQAVGRLAKAFGMKVLAYNRTEYEAGKGIADYVSKEQIFAQSDVISLHIPLSEDTKEMINQEAIEQMKDGVILLNTARGPLLNEVDVAGALKSGKIYALGADVAAEEPIKSQNPLLQPNNSFITPHIGWATQESRNRLIDKAASNIDQYLKGEPTHLVNDIK